MDQMPASRPIPSDDRPDLRSEEAHYEKTYQTIDGDPGTYENVSYPSAQETEQRPPPRKVGFRCALAIGVLLSASVLGLVAFTVYHFTAKNGSASTTASAKVTPLIPDPDGSLHVYAMPIGQGDGQVVQCPDGTLNFYDMGSSSEDEDRYWAGPEIRNFLGHRFGQIRNVLVTHNHWDHYRLLPDVLLPTDDLSGLTNIYISCTELAMASTVSEWVDSINGRPLLATFNGGLPCGPNGPSCGTLDFCPNNPEITFEVMAANLGQHCTDGGNKNMDSIVTKVTYGPHSLMMAGDFEDETSDWYEDGLQKLMVDFYGAAMQVTIYQLAHHGASYLANKPVWRDALMPKSIYSSGDPWYSYGHPRCVVPDSFITYVGTLCKPLETDPASPDYCGTSVFAGAASSNLLQDTYWCGISSTEFEPRSSNDYSIFTLTEDQTYINFIDVAMDGTNWGVQRSQINSPQPPPPVL